MKHLKIYENRITINYVRNTAKEFRELLYKLKPVVYEKYIELTKNENYEKVYRTPDFGDQPYPLDIDELNLENIGYWHDGVQFLLRKYNDDGEIENSFYIDVSNQELESMLIKLDANKYNL